MKQIVYLGGLGDDDPTASPHLRSRQETGERLSAGAVPVTTLRAAMIVGKGSAAFETIVALVDRLPAMITPSWVSTPTQPIALDDVSRYLAGVCGNQAALGESFDAGGPEVMTYRQMMERIADPARSAAVDPRGASADAKIVVALASSRYSCRRFRRSPADRRAEESDDCARGAVADARSLRAHLVRRCREVGVRAMTRLSRPGSYAVIELRPSASSSRSWPLPARPRDHQDANDEDPRQDEGERNDMDGKRKTVAYQSSDPVLGTSRSH